jgi:2-polyprenyl-3-methyl-5-hydroxy-6-metoxy-1,4-benzoquinol methylase
MANKTGKHIDKTFLSIDQAEARGFIHRDYIAHCFRWSHVIKELSRGQGYKTARILDIGCGKLMPMATMLHSSRMAPAYYCGVEYGPVDRANPSVATTLRSNTFNCDVWDYTDIRNFAMDEGEQLFNVVTCFEMIEHIEPSMVHETLQKIKEVTTHDARIFISTPIFNGKAAANHVNEMKFHALANVFMDNGLTIAKMHGTFASITDYQMHLTPAEREVFMSMRDYYDVNVLATFFAPMHPEWSRNVLWELSNDPKRDCGVPFLGWDACPEPHSSSDQWGDLRG